MLLPALKGTRDKAKELGCLANLKQLGAANIMYVNDNDGGPPFGRGDRRLWDYELMPYLNYTQILSEALKIDHFSVFHCPAGTSTGYDIPKYMWKGYAYNYYLTYDTSVSYRKASNISKPGNTLVINDGHFSPEEDNKEGTTFSFWCNHPNFSDQYNYSKATALRHSSKPNVLFFDGHAKLNEVTPTSWGFKPAGVKW
jgi:prepilin-type processing-associated H-X9-DG protein